MLGAKEVRGIGGEGGERKKSWEKRFSKGKSYKGSKGVWEEGEEEEQTNSSINQVIPSSLPPSLHQFHIE